MVGNVLAAPLPSPSGTFSLGSLRKGSWVTELEFFFPLRFITSDLLRECLRKWSGQSGAADLLHVCSSLGFSPVRGLVRGFMDMVFEKDGRYYLVDWKSNHLGNRLEDYRPERLGRVMESHMYLLQYLLYTVALNRYLSLRVNGYDYETHFGGVLYVFLRGVSPEKGDDTGIFRDVPPPAMIAELTKLLVDFDA
jgi:exodeoxyribonuclease V beta subunit